MANTYTLIASTIVGAGGASTIDFQNIPATYNDLQVLISARGTNASYVNLYVGIKFNNTTSNLSSRVIAGQGNATSSFTDTKIYIPASGGNATANSFGNGQFYIANYKGSNGKTVSADGVSESNAIAVEMYALAGLWSDTSAINQITLFDAFALGNFAQYSTAYLYGISNA